MLFLYIYLSDHKYMRMKLTNAPFTTFFLISNILCGQKEPVIIEPESGTPGADYPTLTNGDMTSITPQTDTINGTNPGNALAEGLSEK